MFDKSHKKKIIIACIASFLIMAIITTVAIIVGLNLMLKSALYASPEIKQKKADHYASLADTTTKDGIVFVGDSIIEMYDLQKHFPDKNYINRGISGDRSDGLLARLQTNVIDIAPAKIFIMIGINDMGYDVPLQEYIENYNSILQQLKEQLPDTTIYMFELFPLVYEASIASAITVNSRTHEKIKEWNAVIRDIAKTNQVDTINFYDTLSDDKGKLHKRYTREGLHISEAGYTKISKLLAPYL